MKETIVFVITHKDGSEVKHAYDLEHKDKARDFYKKLLQENLIIGWAIEGK